MPGRQTHTYLDRIMFGKSYWKLHKVIDFPVFLYGRKHREHFHDYVSLICIAKMNYPDDPVACDAACLHSLIDNFCTARPDWKKFLAEKAKNYYKKMRQSKKENKFNRKIKLSHELEKLVRDLKKQIEAKRLYDQFYGLR